MSQLTPYEISAIFPVVEVKVHRGGNLTVVRKSKIESQLPTKLNSQNIRELSPKSLRRLTHVMQCSKIVFRSMITLTYGQFYPRSGKLVKADLQSILKTVRKFSDDYLWFLEFQKRGAPHFHILTTSDNVLPNMRLQIMSKWVARQIKQEYFYANCPVGESALEVAKLCNFNIRSQVWEVIRDYDGAKKYVSKYASKPEQKKVPKQFQDVGRFWGCSKEVSNLEAVRVEIGETELREILGRLGSAVATWDVMPKYVWGVTPNSGKKPPNLQNLDKT